MSEAVAQTSVADHLGRLARLVDELPADRIEAIGDTLLAAYRSGRNVFVAGNGGSAATASHLASDLDQATARPDRPRLRIASLADNVPRLTALANDEGYEHVFSGQLRGRIHAGDVLVVLSVSGSSPNVVEAIRCARGRSATVVALLGRDGGEALRLADEHVLVLAEEYGLVEDVHVIVGHALAAYVARCLDRDEVDPS